jgi:hypothetical protein
MTAHTNEVRQIIQYAQKALPNANFDNVKVKYVQENDPNRSHFQIINVIDSVGKEPTLIAYYKDEGGTLDDRVELWHFDLNKRLFAKGL